MPPRVIIPSFLLIHAINNKFLSFSINKLDIAYNARHWAKD